MTHDSSLDFEFLDAMTNYQYRKGDYHRYLAEFASGNKRKTAATAAHDAYKVRSRCNCSHVF